MKPITVPRGVDRPSGSSAVVGIVAGADALGALASCARADVTMNAKPNAKGVATRDRNLKSVPRSTRCVQTLDFLFGKCIGLASGEELLSIDPAEELDQLRDDASPTCLVASPQARAIISVKVLVEQHVILPVGIGLEFFRTTVNRPPPRLIAEEDPDQSIAYFAGPLKQVHQLARASWTLNIQRVAVITLVRQMGTNHQRVHWHPD